MLQEEFSSNARSDNLDKYSRFFGRAEFSDWCNEPTLKYTEGFRDLLYQVNPYYISCVYKKMFDACSTNQLRIVSDEGLCGDGRDIVGNSTQMVSARSNPESPTRHNVQSDSIDRSNSCIYSQANGLGNQNCFKNTTEKTKDLFGWLTCERPHSASCTVYQNVSLPDSRDAHRRVVFNRMLSPGTFQDNLRHRRKCLAKKRNTARHCSTAKPIDSPKKIPLRDSLDENGGRHLGGSVSCISAVHSPIKVGVSFKHFKRNKSYMEQYREAYTYRKLYETIEKSSFPLPDPSDCPCGNKACIGSHHLKSSLQSKQRWYPNQSHTMEKTESVTFGVPTQKWPPAFKTRSQHSTRPKGARVPVRVFPIPQLDGVQKQNLGFFAPSLTINNYNPTQPHSPFQLSSRCESSTIPSVTPSSSGGTVKGLNSCPSTPILQERHLNQNMKRAI